MSDAPDGTLRRVLFATGGSGGHLFPAIAVAETIRRRFPAAEIRFVTTGREIENRICRDHDFPRVVLPLLPLTAARRQPLKFLSAWRASSRAARDLIQDWRPDCVVGTGGWSMLPPVKAALRSKTPVILCEQNLLPGRATRWLARRVDAVCTSFPGTADFLKAKQLICTGNPVRQAIASLVNEPRSLSRGLLVLGGSQGARVINEAMNAVATTHPEMLRRWRVQHQSGGEETAATLRDAYRTAGIEADVQPFFDDMASRYREAGLVIARAGATTLAELACAGIPAILAPYPWAADDHQKANAEVFERVGAALVISQGDDAREFNRRIHEALSELTANETRRESMAQAMRALHRADAANAVVDVLMKIIAAR